MVKKAVRIKPKREKTLERAAEKKTLVQERLTMEEKVGKDETDTDEEKDDSADVMDMPPIPKRHHLEDDGDDKPRKK